MELTRVGRQTDRPNEVGYRDTVVEPQQGDVVVEVEEAELLRDRTQHEARFGPDRVVAAVVLAERHLDHEPHEAAKGGGKTMLN